MKIPLGNFRLVISNQALRHPIDAVRNQLGEPAVQLERRNRNAPVAVPAPRVALPAGHQASLQDELEFEMLMAGAETAARENTRANARLAALSTLTRNEDLPPENLQGGSRTPRLPPVYRFVPNQSARYIPAPNYRTDEADRQAFRAAFIAYAGGYTDHNEHRFNRYVAEIQALQLQHPDLAAIPTYDLVAVRGLTSGDHRYLNRPLKTLDDPDASPENREAARVEAQRFNPYLKAVVSGLNQLPPYVGVVYRGYDDARPYAVGDAVAFGFLASSSKRINRAFAGNTRYEIQSVAGRDVSRISVRPQEQEVTFVHCNATVTAVVPNPPAAGDRHPRRREVKLRQNLPGA